MKSFVWAFIALLAIAGGTGCHKGRDFFLYGNRGCSECQGRGCAACGKGHGHAHGHRHGMHSVANANGDPHYYGQAGGGACPHCGPGGGEGAYMGQGPGQVAYPYYTTRGPRDFLQNNPSNLGP